MVNSQEIVERTFYISLLHIALELGYTLNPDDYLPISSQNQKRFQEDKDKLSKFIPIFGVGQNLSRGPKECPRITLECKAYYPGTIGLTKEVIAKIDGAYHVMEYPYETKSTTIDVHLVANTQQDMRLLHNIMYAALPPRGYLKPYLNDYNEWKDSPMPKEDNIYIEVGNWYDSPNTEHGILEKIYTYSVEDSVVDEMETDIEIVPIKDITLLLSPDDILSEDDMVKVHVPD